MDDFCRKPMSKPITVKALKKYIKDWPEYDSNGELSEVWIESGENLSTQAHTAMRLNETDLILEYTHEIQTNQA